MRPDLLVERIAARAAAAEAHAERLKKAVPRLASELRRRGATRVILFGSLASGARPHAATDIDLCVEGLTQADAERIELDFSHGEGACPVHLVRWESAPQELREVVERFGVVVGEK